MYLTNNGQLLTLNHLVYISIILLQGFFFQLSAQSFAIEKLLGYEMLTLSEGGKISRFLCSQRPGPKMEKKAIFLFIPGNIHHPLFKKTSSGYDDVLPFNHRKYLDRFHFIIPVPSQTPLVAQASRSENRVENAKLEEVFKNTNWKYIFQVDQLISHLIQQSWVDPHMILVAGYKEGGQLAVRIAQRNRQVTHLVGLSLFSPTSGESPSFPEIQDDCSTQHYLSGFAGRSLLAFGTADPYAFTYGQFFDSMELPGKKKVQILPFPELNASFALVDPWGRDAPESHWKEVASGIISWAMNP